jgi:hypothetical protein
MTLARAFTEAGWDDVETTIGGTADAGAYRPSYLGPRYQPGLQLLDLIYFPDNHTMVTPQRRGLVDGDLLTVLSITPYAVGFGSDPNRVRTYLVRVRCERDGGYYLVEVHRDMLLHVRRPL